jgi:hypothetical protein
MKIIERSATSLMVGDILVDHDFRRVQQVVRPVHNWDWYTYHLSGDDAIMVPAKSKNTIRVTDTMPDTLPTLTNAETAALVEAVRVLRWASEEANARGDLGADVMWERDADVLDQLLGRVADEAAKALR